MPLSPPLPLSFVTWKMVLVAIENKNNTIEDYASVRGEVRVFPPLKSSFFMFLSIC